MLYFFVPGKEWQGPVPPDQDDARQKLEHFNSVLRQALAQEEPALETYFAQLLTLARGVFTPTGFRPESLSTLEIMKDEVVRLVGPRLQNNYLVRLRKAVLVACLLILVITVGLDALVKGGTSSGHPDATGGKTSDATAATETKVLQLGNYVRWDANFSILHIGLLLASSMIGLLFASMVRNLIPTFDNLMSADLMYPWIKLTFYGIAIFIMGTIFEQRWITVSLGEKFSTATINENAIAAIIFGLFLGIAERLVPQEVIRYATEVVMRSRSEG
jgi:hypothetical protein